MTLNLNSKRVIFLASSSQCNTVKMTNTNHQFPQTSISRSLFERSLPSRVSLVLSCKRWAVSCHVPCLVALKAHPTKVHRSVKSGLHLLHMHLLRMRKELRYHPHSHHGGGKNWGGEAKHHLELAWSGGV